MTKQALCIYEFGTFRLDVAKRVLLRDGEVVPLTPKCFDILLAFVENSGEVVGKEFLLERVWPDSFVEEGNLTYNISMLRKALGERTGEHQYIVTVPGRGYQFVETVRALPTERGNGWLTVPEPSDLAVQEKEVSGEHQANSSREASRDGSARVNESFISRFARNKKMVLVVIATSMTAGAAISLVLYNLITGNQPHSNSAEPFRHMKVMSLTTTGTASIAASSPDGKYVVHAMGGLHRHSLWLRHIATGSDKEIIPTAAVDYTALTFSPEGNYIYFIRVESDGSKLCRIPVLGGSFQKLVTDVDSGITFSPGGRQIAYIRGYPERDEAQLIAASADGAGEQTLGANRIPDVFAPRNKAWGPAWSPDGEMIAFALRKDNYWSVMTVRVKDKAVQQLTFEKWAGLGQLAWLSDGTGIIVAAADEDSNPAQQIWYVSYPSGEVRRITNDANDYSGVSLTANSTAIVTVQAQQRSNIWVAPGGDASRAAQITFCNFDGVNGISWSPDGRIVYTTRVRGFSDIWIMNGDGTAQNQLTVDKRDNLGPSVSPDGRYVVFASNRTGDLCVWRVDIDGNNPKRLGDGIGVRTPEITPDGQWVIYTDLGAGKLTVSKVSIEGDNQVRLTDYYSTNPAVSPDGKQIAFIFLDEQASPKRKRIGVMPFDGSRPVMALDLGSKRVRWASDGRAVTYIDTVNGVSNIWALPIDGSPPKQLTDFRTDQIFAHAWSKDGKQLACARGKWDSDVVLISGIR